MRSGGWATVIVGAVLIGPAASRGLAQAADGQKEAGMAIGAAIQRWFDVQAASVLARYRYVEDDRHRVTNRQVQDSLAVKARFRMDTHGYYTVNVGVATGPSFTSGWNNTGLGTGGNRAGDVYLKQLFVAAAPANGVQFFVGGLAFVRGESTEITSYDNDGYLVGERVTTTHPKLYFSEITFTNGYLGDTATPNVFARYHRLGEPNYRQLLFAKRVAPWLTLSGDYTMLSGVGTVRGAISAKTPRARLVDLVQFEQYRRGGANAAFGFAVVAEKTLTGRAIARAGYVDIDENYGGLNADRFYSGRRWYAQGDFTLARDLTAWLFVSRTVRNGFAVPNAMRVDVVVTYNAIGPLRRAGLCR